MGSVGMGLAVVKILAEGMSGSVRYERQDGWSCFIVTLPSREEPAASLDDMAGAGTHEPDGVFGHQIAASQPLEEGWPGIGAP